MNKNLWVIDTNVALTANDQSEVSKACVLACIKQLETVMQQGCVALDDKWLILREYMHKLHSSGQPGMGDQFLKWVLTNQRNPIRCTHVSITPKPENPLDFLEFPKHPQLQQFDHSDRKFVAVSANHPDHPPILQAVDSKWWGWQKALAECGVSVIFVCPAELAEKYQKKIGQR